MHSLTSLPPSQTPPSLLIVAHKYDLLKSTASAPQQQLAINRVRTVLERELEKRRVASAEASGVGSTGVGTAGIGGADSEDSTELGGLDSTSGGSFRFADWEGGPINFVGTTVDSSASADEEKRANGIAPLREWLEEI
jgi:signal recognition particle receptor subunit beta